MSSRSKSDGNRSVTTTPLTRHHVLEENDQEEGGSGARSQLPKRKLAGQGSTSSTVSQSRKLELEQEERLLNMEHNYTKFRDELQDEIDEAKIQFEAAETVGQAAEADKKVKKLERDMRHLTRDFTRETDHLKKAFDLSKRKVQLELEEEQDLGPVGEDDGYHDYRDEEDNPTQTEIEKNPQQQNAKRESQKVDPVDKDALLIRLMENQLRFMENTPEKQWRPEDLPSFNGKPEDWPIFINELIRSTPQGQEKSSQNAIRLRKALKGAARETVAGLLHDPNNCIKIVDLLRERFGRSELVIKALIQKADECKAPDAVKPESFVEYAIAVIQLVESIKSVGEVKFFYDQALLDKLVGKLPLTHITAWLESSEYSRANDLAGFGEWLEKRMKLYLRISKPPVKEESEKPKKMREKRGSAIAAATSKSKPEKKENRSKEDAVCSYCDRDNHKIRKCFFFKKLSISERSDAAKKKGLCFRCLSKEHLRNECTSTATCDYEGCNASHHSLLHRESKSPENTRESEVAAPVAELSDSEDKNKATTVKEAGSSKPLSVVRVRVRGPCGIRKVYALMDSGATSTIIDAELAKNLGLCGPSFKHVVDAIKGFRIEETAQYVKFDIAGAYKNAKYYTIGTAATMQDLNLSPYTQNAKEAKEKWNYLKKARLESFQNVTPTVIIGEDYPYLTVHRELLQRGFDDPIAKRTILGWVIAGHKVGESSKSRINYFHQNEDENLDMILKQSFSLDSYGIYPAANQGSIEDQRAVKILETTVMKVGSAWECGLLWRNEAEPLPDSRQEAFSRLVSNERRMKKDPVFMKMYHDKILEYEKKGYITKLSPEQARENSENTFYLPHFGVFNVHKPGKLRLVFDAACKVNGKSLNDHLLVGPDLIRPLPAVLMNLRRHNVVITGDVEDMFHRVMVRKEDRSSQRFLWRNIQEGKNPVETYEMNVLIFGACSSPSSAIYVMNHNAKQFQDVYPDAVTTILQDFYCDDCLTGSKSVEKAIQLRKEICEISAAGNFHVKKWLSNSKEVMTAIPEDERALGAKDFATKDLLPTEKLLGLWWNPEEDAFTFTTNFKKLDPELLGGRRPTKREVSSILGSVFDPLGFISNFKIRGMILLQRIWRSGVEWDDEVTDAVYEEWKIWIENLKQLDQVKIPRLYCYDIHLAKEIQLHVLVDASEEATSACAYLRITTGDSVQVSFVMGKAKVAPIKKVTIPRLELMAAVMGVNMADTIMQQLKVPVGKRFFWSDSRTALAWIRSEKLRYKEFVANRVSRIHMLSNVSEWKWIPTSLNVADEATRMKSLEVEESLWLTGPLFLLEEPDKWPAERERQVPEEVDSEVRSNMLFTLASVEEPTEVVINIERFSSYNRMIRAQAAVTRAGSHWLKKAKKTNEDSPWTRSGGKQPRLLSSITPDDLISAEMVLVKKVQSDAFAEDLAALKNGQLTKKSKIWKLSPILQSGVIVLDTRIRNAEVEDSVKWPVLLPARHHFTKLLIMNEHELMGHQSNSTVHNNLRKKYWIIDGRTAVRNGTLNCQKCKLGKVKPNNPKMGSLPPYRLSHHQPPFTFTGADLFGPLEVVVGRHREKRWVVVFTCMVTRAIHLEVVYSLSTDETIMALSRFMDVRGRAKHLYTDNGTNFTGAKREIANKWGEVDWSQVMDRKRFQEIKWSFSPPYSPHFGGAWEAMVKKTKRVLKATLQETHPRDQTLLTMLKGAENVVNSTPLSYVSSDASDLEALTANHFLRGFTDLGPTIPGAFDEDDAACRAQWKRAQYFIKCFWERWVKEVLPELARRKKWFEDTEPIGVGDLVFIVEDNVMQKNWKRGVITSVFPGADGIIRVVEVTTASPDGKKNVYKRGVDRICPLGLKMGKSARD